MDNRTRPAAISLCPLVARDAELARLLELWRASRLVTLFGPSGAGKSALARAAADRLAEEQNSGVRCLDARGAATGTAFLRLLTRSRRWPSGQAGYTVSEPLDPERSPDPSRQPVPRPCFLLLDDVPSGARAGVRGLLQWLVQNPDVHLLIVTGRPLDLVGERSMPLSPLAVSAEGSSPSPAEEFFAFHSRLNGQDEILRHRETVSRICRSLDGLPAALEAAAGLLGVLPLPEVARICCEEPLSLWLRGRSLREMAAATWDDLPAGAQEYLSSNAGWAGSFSDQAGAVLVGGRGDARTVPLLLQLGLLVATDGGARRRYRIASPLRAWLTDFGLGRAAEARERRARCLLALAERTRAGLEDGGIDADDLPSIRWAWRWLAGRREGELLERFALAMADPLTNRLGDAAEAEELLASALSWAQDAGRTSVPALETALAVAEACQGDLQGADTRLNRLLERELRGCERAAAQASLAVVRAASGQFLAAVELRLPAAAALRRQFAGTGVAEIAKALAWSLWGLADDHRHLGQSEQAWAALEESREWFDVCHCEAGRAAVQALRAVLHLDRDEVLEARGCAREAASVAERTDDRPGLARALQISGRIVGRDNPARGLEELDRAVAMWEAMRRHVDLAAALLDVASLAAAHPDGVERQTVTARRALDLARSHRLAAVEAAALLSLAEAYQRAGQSERAECYALQAVSASEATDDARVRSQSAQWRATHMPESGREASGPSPECPNDASMRPLRQETPALTPSPSHPLTLSPPILIRLLGPFTVEGPTGTLASGSLRPREQRVLARLALSPGEVVPRDELLDLFWHRSPVATAERSLRTVVSSLRASIRPLFDGQPPRFITGRFDGYRLETDACAVDADLFARAVRAARGTAPEPPVPASALTEWQRAAELYRGDLLLAFQYEDWCLTQRERLRSNFLDVLFRLAQEALDRGRIEEACSHGARMVEIDPTEERAHRLLMRCYVFLDRPAEALRQFERCRTILWEELAARPGPATVSLLQAIREGVSFAEQDASELESAEVAGFRR